MRSFFSHEKQNHLNKNEYPSVMSDNPIKVSIIIPVYNVQSLIDKCIDSLKAQTLREIEFIFIDDGSTDNSIQAAKNWAEIDERVHILQNDYNMGAGLSRNRGIAIARGEYIGFVDPDDYISDNFYELLYHKAIDGMHAIAKGTIVIVKADGTLGTEGDLNTVIIKNRNTRSLYYLFRYEHLSAIYHKSLFEDGTVKYGSSRCSEDSLFLLRVCTHTDDIVFETNAKYYYVQREGSLWHTSNETRFFADLDSMDEKMDYLLSHVQVDDDMYGYIAAKGHRYWMNYMIACARDAILNRIRTEYENRLMDTFKRLPKRTSDKPLQDTIFRRALIEYGVLLPNVAEIPNEGKKDAVEMWKQFLIDVPNVDKAFHDYYLKVKQ